VVALGGRLQCGDMGIAHGRQYVAGVEDIGFLRVAVRHGAEGIGESLFAAVRQSHICRDVRHQDPPGGVVIGEGPAVPSAGSFGYAGVRTNRLLVGWPPTVAGTEPPSAGADAAVVGAGDGW